jgi:hypothetical protein
MRLNKNSKIIKKNKIYYRRNLKEIQKKKWSRKNNLYSFYHLIQYNFLIVKKIKILLKTLHTTAKTNKILIVFNNHL